MATADTEAFLPTRRSLLSRLRNWEDQQSWQEFFDTYGRLIYGAALKAGLTPAEAEDVLQETVLLVAKKLPGFRYDPALGSFKGWLAMLTRRRIAKQFQKRLPGLAGPGSARASAGGDDTRLTATIDRIPDPVGADFERDWEAAWGQNLYAAAVAQVKRQIKPRQYQMFDLYVVQEWPAGEVARALRVTVAQVYVNKHRVARLIRKELERLRRRMEPPGQATGD